MWKTRKAKRWKKWGRIEADYKEQMRFSLYLRGDELRCVWCGKRGIVERLRSKETDLVFLTIEHIIPKNRGGTDEIDNLAWACSTCNKKRRSMDAWSFARRYCNKDAPIWEILNREK